MEEQEEVEGEMDEEQPIGKEERIEVRKEGDDTETKKRGRSKEMRHGKRSKWNGENDEEQDSTYN